MDIDGDGIKELICNVMYGDGVQATIIYRRQGNQILQGFASDLLDEDSENIISMSLVTVYLPEENVVEISYYRMDLEQHLSKKYEIDFEKIKYWEEVVLTP